MSTEVRRSFRMDASEDYAGLYGAIWAASDDATRASLELLVIGDDAVITVAGLAAQFHLCSLLLERGIPVVEVPVRNITLGDLFG